VNRIDQETEKEARAHKCCRAIQEEEEEEEWHWDRFSSGKVERRLFELNSHNGGSDN
jgi:hypothetical protein